MPTSPRLLAPLLSTLLATTALAQNHLLVPSQFAEIGLAVQSANPGDIIEVTERLQPYLPFVIDRTITIVGTAGEQRAPVVEVTQGIGITIQLAPGERATLSRIDVHANVAAVATGGMTIQGGAVTLEDCRIRSGTDLTGQTVAVDIANADVSIAFCRFEGGRGGTALRATNAYVSMTKSRCFAGSIPAGTGIVVQDSELHASEAWLLGGEEFGAALGGTALRVQGASQVTLHDSAASGGFGQPGGNGLVNTSANAVEHSDVTFAGGSDFSTGATAPATVGPTTNNPALVGLRWSEPPYRRGTLRAGMPWGVSVRAAPNSLGLLAFAFEASGFAPLFSRQPGLLPQDFALLVPIALDGLGYGTFPGTLPNDPTLSGATLWAQGVAGNWPLEASPPTAVVVR